jgi:hypothetical protein
MKHGTRLGSRIAEVHNGSSLFTGDAGQGESNIRRWIIEKDWLEAAARAAGEAPPVVSVPVGFTTFPGEIWAAPRSWVETVYPGLAYFNEVDKGGHFAAWEQPQLDPGGVPIAALIVASSPHPILVVTTPVLNPES